MNSNRQKFWKALPWIWMIAALGITMLWLYCNGRPYVDSDMAAEMVYAHQLNEEGRIFMSPNWWYGGEVRILYVEQFYRIGLLIFPHNWYAARIFGQALCLMTLAASYLYLCGKNGLGLRNSGVWGAAALMCPFGIWYFWYATFFGCYATNMIQVLFSLGLVLHLLHPASRVRRALQYLCLAALCFLFGLETVKGLMAIYLPMVVAAPVVVAMLLHANNKEELPKAVRFVVLSLYAAALAAAGYLVNSKFLSGYHGIGDHNYRVWAGFKLTNLLDTWSDFLSLLGYQNSGFWDNHTELFSLSGVLGAAGLLLAAALVIGLFRLIKRWRGLSMESLTVLMTFVMVCLVQGSVFAFTAGGDGVNPSYWLTPLPLMFVVMQMACENETFTLQIAAPRISAIGFMACIIASSVASVTTYMHSSLRSRPDLYQVRTWLLDRGYTKGYASFWNADVLVEWSSGELEIWACDAANLEVLSWLQPIAHTENPPEGEFFYLVSEAELVQENREYLEEQSNVVYHDENGYIVLRYESYDQLVEDFQR